MKISVVIPTFNREREVVNAINSALCQSYKDLEVIVVDDHSEDNTQGVVQSIEDDRVQYALNRRSKGAQGARNTGIEIANGEWIAFLDSDDFWRRGKVKRQVEYIKETKEEVHSIYSEFERKRDGSIFWSSNIGEGRIIYKERFLYSNPLGGFSPFMVRREVLKKVGLLDEDLSAFQDKDLYYRVCADFNIHNISEILVVVNLDSNDRISDKDDERFFSSLKLYKKYKNNISQRGKGLDSCMKADIAHYAALSGRWKYFVRYIYYIPLSIFYCPYKFMDFVKSLILSNKYIRRIQTKVLSR